jgi:arsenate reductase
MPKSVTIYHNPRCSKSRQTLALIQERGIEPEVIEYLKVPPTPKRLGELVDLLGVEPHDLVRKKESAYQEAGLSSSSSREEILQAIASHPVLLERPVVVAGDQAALGRPPENVLEIL